MKKGAYSNFFLSFILTSRRVVAPIRSSLPISTYPLLASMWRPMFLISIINANDWISWVKPTDIGQI
jgi:hypothetical protein